MQSRSTKLEFRWAMPTNRASPKRLTANAALALCQLRAKVKSLKYSDLLSHPKQIACPLTGKNAQWFAMRRQRGSAIRIRSMRNMDIR
jgi:hypothetical protein